MKGSQIILVFAFCVLVVILCIAFWLSKEQDDTKVPVDDTVATETFLSPLYFTFVMHTEEDTGNCKTPKARIPDYDGDEALLLHFTDVMRKFGKIAQNHGVRINFGTDWTFSNGVENFDPTFYKDMEAMGHEIDAHAHESCIQYNEVRNFIIDAGGNPTAVASGVNEEEIQNEMSYFDQYYPDFQILWGVASPGHEDGEEMSGWVWRPSRDDWTQHDPDGAYIHIGHGNYLQSIDLIKEAIDNRKENAINTYAVFAAPREFRPVVGTEGINDEWTVKPGDCMYWETKLEWWDDFLTQVDVYVATGEIEYASLTEIATEFEKQEDNLIFDQDSLPRSTQSMTERSRDIGYCF